MRFCAQAQPHEHTHRPLSQEKVTAWCTIGRNGIIGLYFFEEENENWVTMDTDRYIVLMWTNFIPALRRKRGVDMNTVIYQQNGAPPLFCVAPTSFGHPTPPTWTHVTRPRPRPRQFPDPGIFEGQHKKGDQAPTSWHDSTVNDNFNVRVAAVIRQEGAWIEHIINY